MTIFSETVTGPKSEPEPEPESDPEPESESELEPHFYIFADYFHI